MKIYSGKVTGAFIFFLADTSELFKRGVFFTDALYIYSAYYY